MPLLGDSAGRDVALWCGMRLTSVKPLMPNAARTRIREPASATRLGDRVRQLRVSAGLTQTDLAGTRFSKEYVSQIERGKTRPTRETIEWLAQQLGVDADFLQNGVSTDERSRIETMLARAEALTRGEQVRGRDRADRRREDRRPRHRLARARGSPALRRGVGAAGRRRRPRGDRAARTRRARSPRARASRTSIARTSSSASASAATSFRVSPPRSRCSTRRSSSPSAPASRAICFARRSSTGARAAGAASATTKPRARTSSARSSSRSRSKTGA